VIVGTNEIDQHGSHNMVTGDMYKFSSYGGIELPAIRITYPEHIRLVPLVQNLKPTILPNNHCKDCHTLETEILDPPPPALQLESRPISDNKYLKRKIEKVVPLETDMYLKNKTTKNLSE